LNPATRLSYEGRYEKVRKADDLNDTTFINGIYPNLSLDFASGG
jgi:hypothetical protein